MSHINRKIKTLATKRKNTKLENHASIFDSFVSVRSSKKQQDESLLREHPNISTVTQENEEDTFKFLENTSCSSKDNILFQTTISPEKNMFAEETKTEISILDSCFKSKPEDQNKHNDSSLFFESGSKKESKEFEVSSVRKDSCTAKKEKVMEEISFDDIVPIPDESAGPKPTVRDVNLHEEKDLENDGKDQCPVCLKTVGASKYLSHIKSCAAKNKLSTQKLLSALQLHKKQLAERKELGLGLPAQSYRAKVSPKRSKTAVNGKKGPIDSSLQLALALSASLHSVQEDEVIQEAEALKEAGLSDEAEQKLSTLEKYGFASDCPVKPINVAGGSKFRPLPSSLLLRRTREDRERIITEKVAIILINDEESVTLDSFTLAEPALKSRILKEKLNSNCHLWTKSRCPENEKREGFYVKSLAQFVSPSKAEVGEDLRRLSQLAGRMNTPVKEEVCDFLTPSKPFNEVDETDISDLPTPSLSSFTRRGKNIDSSSQRKMDHETFSRLSSLAEGWGKLVNNEVLSDIKIRCKDCVVIPAHKLVFYVRCPKILDEAVKQNGYEDILNWESVLATSVIAFLDFLYCSRTDKIMDLDADEILNITAIADRLDFKELKNQLSDLKTSLSTSRKGGVKKNLFEFDHEKKISDCVEYENNSNKDAHLSHHVSCNNFEKITSKRRTRSNSENVSGRESPDMFADSGVTTNVDDSHQERDELDILVSLMGKPTQCNVGFNKTSNFLQQEESMVIESPVKPFTSSIFHRKRKASNNSFSEDEDIVLSKKHCSNLSQSGSCKSNRGEETFDLTQSSNSSNEEKLAQSNLEMTVNCSPQNSHLKKRIEEEKFDLTQSSKSSDDDICEYTKKVKSLHGSMDDITQKIFKESIYKDDSLIDTSQKNFNESSSQVDTIYRPQDSDDSLVDLTQKTNDKSNHKDVPRSSDTNQDSIDPQWDGFLHEDCYSKSTSPKSLQVHSIENNSKGDKTTISTPRISLHETTTASKSLSSNKKSQHIELPRSSSNTSLREAICDVSMRDNYAQDYIDPVWDGYDDYYQVNCKNNTFLHTPIKHYTDKSLNHSTPTYLSLEKSRTKQMSLSPKVCLTDNSSLNKSPKKLSQATYSPSTKSPISIKSISSDSKSPPILHRSSGKTCITPSSSVSIKCVSSDKKSPKNSSQTFLNSYSTTPVCVSKQTYHSLSINDSDIEVVPETSEHSDSRQVEVEITKSRKNLTFQFETESCNSKENAASLSLISPSTTANERKNTSLRKDSLAAMQRLLDDSFEVNDSLLDAADALAAGKCETDCAKQSKSSSRSGAVTAGASGRSSLDTPSPGIIVSDQVTPLPDYSGMKTPALKKALTRFGLKPSLGRRKAKLLLRYIYDQTHPVMPNSESQMDEFRQPESRAPKSPRKTYSSVVSPRKLKSPSHSPQKTETVNLDDSEPETDEPCSQMSTSSSISSSASLPEESYHEAEEALTQDLSNRGDVHSCIRSLIKGDPGLHRKVLLYEPIYLEHLLARLKENGIKTKSNDVMDYLDEQCITFRTNSWKKTNEKRRQKQKSPKKKNSQNVGPSGYSPSKSQAPVVKKRGRPKKTSTLENTIKL